MSEEQTTILLADDSENDLLLMQLAFAKAEFNADLQIVRDGEEAIAYLQGQFPYEDRDRHPLPTLILLDLNMPGKMALKSSSGSGLSPTSAACLSSFSPLPCGRKTWSRRSISA